MGVEENKSFIRISVRNLVEFILRSGDLDNRRGSRADKDAMLMGGKIHRKIQRRMGRSIMRKYRSSTKYSAEDSHCL